MSDDPTPTGDGDPIPADEQPEPVIELEYAQLQHSHIINNAAIPRDRIAFVHEIDHERGVAICAVRLPDIEIPLDSLRRWRR